MPAGDRTGPASQVYRAGQIPGARYIDWRVDLVDDAEDSDAIRLAAPDRIAEVAARAGIGDGTTVVIYDDTQGLYAARVWWSLQAYGLEQVRILDGGFPAWEAEGRPIVARPVRRDRAARRPVHAARAEPHAPHDLGRPRDARRAERGAARRPRARGVPRLRGQYPAARAYPGRRERAGRQRCTSPVASTFAAATSSAACSTRRTSAAAGGWWPTTDPGVAAAKLAFVLMLLGHDDVAVYDGGWAEWGNRLDLPVDR